MLRVFKVFWAFRVSGVFGVFEGVQGLVRTKTTRRTWGSILTPSRKKCSKQLKNEMDKNEVKIKMVFRAYNSK